MADDTTRFTEAFSLERPPCSFGIETNGLTLRGALHEYLVPYYGFGQKTDPTYRLSVLRVGARPAQARRLEWSEFCVAANLIDPRKNVSAQRATGAGCEWIAFGRSGNLARFDAQRRTIEYYAVREEGVLRDVKLIVRDVTNASFLRDGFCELHASAVTLPEDSSAAVLILGAKNSGKTSLLVDGLRRGGRLISNGRVFARISQGELEVFGTPERIFLRPITIDSAGLSHLFPAVNPAYFSQSSCPEVEKVCLEYPDVVRKFDARPTPHARVEMLVTPFLSRDVQSVPPLHEVIADNVYGYDAIERRLWSTLVSVDRARLEANRAAMAAYVACFEPRRVVRSLREFGALFSERQNRKTTQAAS